MKNENASCWFKVGMLCFILVAVLGCAALAHADSKPDVIYNCANNHHIEIFGGIGFHATVDGKATLPLADSISDQGTSMLFFGNAQQHLTIMQPEIRRSSRGDHGVSITYVIGETHSADQQMVWSSSMCYGE